MSKDGFQAARDLVQQAIELKRNNEYAEARRLLESGRERFPTNAYIQASLADLYYRLKQFQQAESLADEILADKPGEARALTVKGNVALAKRDYAAAAEHFASAYLTQQTSYLALRWAKALSRLEKYEEAAELLRTWQNQEPDNSYVQKMLAGVYEKQGEPEKAEKIYQAALQEDPRDQFAYKEKLKLKLKDQPAAAAVAELQNILRIKKHRQNPHLHSLLADRLEEADRPAEALDHYRRALDLAPANRYLLKQIGFSLYKLGEYDQALTCLQEVFQEDPGDYYTRSVLVNIYTELGREEDGIEFLQEIIRTNPGYNSLWGIIKKLARTGGTDKDGREED